MNQNPLDEFNSWYSNNYKMLRQFANRNKITADEQHESYIKIVEKIMKTGYDTNQYSTYCKLAMRNLHLNNCKKNRYYHIDVDDEDFRTSIELKLLEIDDYQRDDLNYQEQLQYFSKMLFLFIDTRQYTEEEKFIFRSYFLMNGRLTYAKLTEITGINKTKLSEVLSRMKSDIKNNLENWIKEYNKNK